MKAVLHLHSPLAAQTHRAIELAKEATSVSVSGDIVTIQRGARAVAAARLGEQDYITLDGESNS